LTIASVETFKTIRTLARPQQRAQLSRNATPGIVSPAQAPRRPIPHTVLGTTCTPCATGTYTSSTGQSACTECVAGTNYQDQSGQTVPRCRVRVHAQKCCAHLETMNIQAKVPVYFRFQPLDPELALQELERRGNDGGGPGMYSTTDFSKKLNHCLENRIGYLFER